MKPDGLTAKSLLKISYEGSEANIEVKQNRFALSHSEVAFISVFKSVSRVLTFLLAEIRHVSSAK